jgi:hypothetical protein
MLDRFYVKNNIRNPFLYGFKYRFFVSLHNGESRTHLIIDSPGRYGMFPQVGFNGFMHPSPKPDSFFDSNGDESGIELPPHVDFYHDTPPTFHYRISAMPKKESEFNHSRLSASHQREYVHIVFISYMGICSDNYFGHLFG